MNTTKKDLWQSLLKLTLGNESATEAAASPEASRLPEVIADKLGEIVEAFRQNNCDKERLAQELLSCYNYLNIAFTSTVSIARCKEVHQAIQLLVDEMTQAIDSHYGYYWGTFAGEFSALRRQADAEKDAILIAQTIQDPHGADDFFQRNKQALRAMADDDAAVQIKMIDYHGTYNLDYEGRGNVLALRLVGDDQQLDSLGTLFFVRTSEREPFIAMEMNFAGSLARMGSAVLGNIIYAQKINQVYLQTIMSLVKAMEAKDEYTSGHSVRVAEMACELGGRIGLDSKQMEHLDWAGRLHDIGKIGIRDDVLHKAGKLTEEEFAHIKTHPLKSYIVLEPLEALQDILAAVRHHHEHFDGSGYPDGMAGTDIPLLARILQVADVWDALTSTRSYREAMSSGTAMEIMRQEAGTTMDPELVAWFLEMMTEQTVPCGERSS